MNFHHRTAAQAPSAHVLSPGYLQQLMLVCQWHDWHSSASLWLPVAYNTQQTEITTPPDTWTEEEWGAYINEYSELLNNLMSVAPRTEATVRLILESGCNLDDIARLRWADIDIQHRRISVPRSPLHGEHERLVISEGLSTLLDELPREQRPFEASADEIAEELEHLSLFVGCGELRCIDLQHTAVAYPRSTLISMLDEMADTRSKGRSVH